MTLGYQCDAECESLADQAFGTITLDLSELPLTQAAHLYVLLMDQDVIDGSERKYIECVRGLQGEGHELGSFPTVELHLCVGHALTALQSVGVADIPDDPREEIEDQQT